MEVLVFPDLQFAADRAAARGGLCSAPWPGSSGPWLRASERAIDPCRRDLKSTRTHRIICMLYFMHCACGLCLEKYTVFLNYYSSRHFATIFYLLSVYFSWEPGMVAYWCIYTEFCRYQYFLWKFLEYQKFSHLIKVKLFLNILIISTTAMYIFSIVNILCVLLTLIYTNV